jgi:hypothetical protein
MLLKGGGHIYDRLTILCKCIYQSVEDRQGTVVIRYEALKYWGCRHMLRHRAPESSPGPKFWMLYFSQNL